MNTTRIVAVRHGETAWNKAARLQGHTDIALNEHGQWQAQQVARALADEPFNACYASDLARALHTAQAVATQQNLAVQVTPGLRERSFGAFEGQTWTELEQAFPAETTQWRKRVPDFAPPQGESLLQLQQRVLSTVNALAEQHMSQHILLVAHGGVLDMLYRAATHLNLQAPRSWELPNCAINRLLWSPEGLGLVGWGDVRHLQGDAACDERHA